MTKSSGPGTEPWGTRCYARCKNINPTINKRSNLFETSFLFLHVPAVPFLSCYFLPYLHPLSSLQKDWAIIRCAIQGTASARTAIRSAKAPVLIRLVDVSAHRGCVMATMTAATTGMKPLKIAVSPVNTTQRRQSVSQFFNFYSCSSVYFTYSIIAMPLL